MPLKVIGSGLGRTGTYSLKTALEHLGFGKCYHMTELFQFPEGVKYFKKAEKGEDVKWDELFYNYNSCVDYPGARYFEQITDHYPNAKVIHTVRDADEWYNSALKTIFMARNLNLKQLIKFALKYPVSREVQKRLHAFLYSRKLMKLEFGIDFSEKKKIIEKFYRHTENVMKKVDQNRLLIYNISEGWEPLCRFFNVQVPKENFPVSNSYDEFMNKIDIIGSGGYLAEIKLQETIKKSIRN
ncbi:MAG TPA: sulfotransferase [Ignavibacteria bacterium]|nr:sulfotransferase [Ignavibacteria bacterium]